MSAIVMGGLLGLVLGVRHTLEPDHVAAVGTFVPTSATPRRAAGVGALWGAGHAAAIWVLGAALIGLRPDMPVWLDSALEFAVGVILIGLGMRAIAAGRSVARSPAATDPAQRPWGPFGVGLIHGVAGTGAVVLLASATMPGDSALLFLALFGVGSVLGMAAIASALSVPLQRLGTVQSQKARLLWVAGGLSAAVGVWWAASAASSIAAVVS